MARSVLGSFVSGTRQMLAAQLFVSVGAVGLAGWTLAVTNDLIRERARLNDRVIQLEETLAANNIVVPSTVTVVDPPPQPARDAYPPSVTLPQNGVDAGAVAPPAPDGPVPEAGPTRGEEAAPPAAEAAPAPGFNPGQLLEIFTPPPPMRVIVLHARSEADGQVAARIAEALMRAGQVQVTIDVMAPRDQRESGYAYFDGRQSRAAAALMQSFHDIARQQEIAPWSAQLRGIALPAQGEYSADRLDIVLPPLPVAGPTLRFNPGRFRDPAAVAEPAPPPPPIIR